MSRRVVRRKRQRKTEMYGDRLVPLPYCTTQNPHGLDQNGSQGFTVRGRRITARVMAELLVVSEKRLWKKNNVEPNKEEVTRGLQTSAQWQVSLFLIFIKQYYFDHINKDEKQRHIPY
jgi:hypothetical protein